MKELQTSRREKTPRQRPGGGLRPKPTRRVTPVENGTDTAARILGAATRLFADQGYDGTSVKQICERADVNIAAIHYHFGSKEDLYVKIIRDFGDCRAFKVGRLLIVPDTYAEFAMIMRLVLNELVDCFMAAEDVARIVLREAQVGRACCIQVFEETFIPLHHRFVEFFQGSIERATIAASIDPQVAAEYIIGAFNMRLITADALRLRHCRELRDPLTRKKFVDGTLALILGGMQPR